MKNNETAEEKLMCISLFIGTVINFKLSVMDENSIMYHIRKPSNSLQIIRLFTAHAIHVYVSDKYIPLTYKATMISDLYYTLVLTQNEDVGQAFTYQTGQKDKKKIRNSVRPRS